MAGQKRVLLLCGDYVEDYEVIICFSLFFFFGFWFFQLFDKLLCEIELSGPTVEFLGDGSISSVAGIWAIR